MGIIQDAIANMKAKKERMRDAEEGIKIQESIERRKKDADERELESYMEEHRKRDVKHQLERFRQRKSNEIWTSNCFTNNRNMFNGSNVFAGNHGQRWF